MRTRRYLLPATVFLLSLVVQTLFLSLLPARWSQNQSDDYLTYYRPVAERVLEGRGISTADGAPATRYPPGYPIILAALFWLASGAGLPTEVVVLVFNALAAASSCVLVFLIARSVFHERVGLAAGALWATYPFNLWLTKQPNSEVPFILLLFLAVYASVRALKSAPSPAGVYLLVGALIGCASLIRPIALALALPVIVCVITQTRAVLKSRLAFCGLVLAGNAFAVAPWEFWAWHQTASVIPLSTSGSASVLDGLTLGSKSYDPLWGVEANRAPVPDNVRGLMDRIRDECVQTPAMPTCSLGDIAAFLRRELLAEPLTVLALLGFKATRAWYATDAGWWEPLIALIQAPYLILAAGGAALAWRRVANRHLVLLLLLIISYFWVMTVAVVSILRYMTPGMGLLMVFVGLAVVAAAERLMSLRVPQKRPVDVPA